MTLDISGSGIGQQKWKNSTLSNIRLTQNVIKTSDKSCSLGRALDPLPNLREILAELSNKEAIRYSRGVRVVVLRLREHFLGTNEEIKSLLRIKQLVEKKLEHIRKDIKLNIDTQRIRGSKPSRENDQDGADDLLKAEAVHLQNLKRDLEQTLFLINNQLQNLDQARLTLQKVLTERSRVLDLLNVSTGSSRFTDVGDVSDLTHRDSDSYRPKTSPSDPLSPYTPACEAAIKDSETERYRSRLLRNEACETVDKVHRLQQSAHKSVNDGLTRKMAETLMLQQHLDLASADNKTASNRATRWLGVTEKTRGYNLGPVSSSDFYTNEKVHRPIIRTFQRHPGTQVPEAQEIIKASDALHESLVATSKNIELLRICDMKLQQDIADKSQAFHIDSAALRRRRQKADHRWPIGSPF